MIVNRLALAITLRYLIRSTEPHKRPRFGRRAGNIETRITKIITRIAPRKTVTTPHSS